MHKKQAGFTLVELMVGSIVGLFVLLAANALYLTSAGSAKETRSLNNLNQNMRNAMDIISADLRRAGHYVAKVGAGQDNAYAKRTGTITDIQILDGGSCILYAYDREHNGALPVPSSNFFGFRLNGDTIETLDGVASAITTTDQADCSELTWLPMNLPAYVKFDALTFTYVAHRCAGIQDKTDGTMIKATWDSVAPADCRTIPAAFNDPAQTAAPALPANVSVFESRDINVSMTAHFVFKDHNGAEVSLGDVPNYLNKTYSESVKISNDFVHMAGSEPVNVNGETN